jgi:hypothetical protein
MTDFAALMIEPVRLLACQERLKLLHQFQTGTDFRTQSLKITHIITVYQTYVGRRRKTILRQVTD